MKGASRMYVQMSLLDTRNATSSPESAVGRMPCVSQDGRMSGPSGPDPALASRTPRQALEAGMTTRGPYGGRGAGSSLRAALQLSLAGRVQALVGAGGSPEYALALEQWGSEEGR